MFHVKPLHKLLFYCFIFTIPIQTRILFNADQSYINEYFSYHLGFFVYLSDLIFFVCFMDWLIFGAKHDSNRSLFVRILAYFSLILVTLFHVKQLDLGLYETVKWLELFAILVYAWWNLDRQDIKTILGILFVSGLVQAGIAIIQFHVQHGLNLSFLGEYVPYTGTPGLANLDVNGVKLIRAYGTMPHPNVLAGFLISSLFAGLYYVSRETLTDRRETSWFHAVPARALATAGGTILILLGIFFSFSRIGWISAAIGIAGFLIYNLWKRNRSGLIALAVIVLVSCGTILIGYKDLALARGSESLNNQSVTLRSDFNRMGIEIIKKYPALGVGVGNYIEAQKDLYRILPWQHQPPHNIYIFLAAELGIFGLSLFLVILYELVSLIWKQRKELLTFTLLLTVFVFLFIGLFDHYLVTIQQGRLIFFTVLGLLAATNNSEAQETKKRP